jgi:hypothetical protein
MSSLPVRRPRVKVYPPVEVEARWASYLHTIVEALRWNVPTVLMVRSGEKWESYFVALHQHKGAVLGYRLTHVDEPERCYDLPADLSECCCPDHAFRRREDGQCRHMKALRQALAEVGLL